jgi:hypothetical protein
MARNNNPVAGCICAMFGLIFVGFFLLRLPFMFFSYFPIIIFIIIIFSIIISASSRRQREIRIKELNSERQNVNPYNAVNSIPKQIEIQDKKPDVYLHQKIRFCHFCGAELEQDAIFCHGCGIIIER